MPRICEARQESDEMVCNRCKLWWHVKDPEPPTCRVLTPSSRECETVDVTAIHEKGIAVLRRILEQ